MGIGPINALTPQAKGREERVPTKALTLSGDGKKYCAKTAGPRTAMRGAGVTPHHFADGRLRVYCRERPPAFTAYGAYPVPDPAGDEKTPDARIDAIVAARRALAKAA